MPKQDILKNLGVGAIISASSFLDKKEEIIPLSPALDLALSGGIPTGTWVIMSGAPKCGKSLTSLQLAANAQKAGMKVFYSDVECRLKKMNLTGIAGLDLNNFDIIQSTKEKILSAEDHLNTLIDLIKSEPHSVFILDSSSALCASKEMVEEITSATRALGPKLLASFCRQMGGVIPVQDSIIIIIQHLIANTSGYGVPWMEDGGQKIRYQVDVKLRAKTVSKWEVKEEQIGQIVEWEIATSALGKPGNKAKSYIRYGQGLDYISESIEIGCDLGLISKAGAWFKLEFIKEDKPEKEEKELKFHGQENLYQYLADNIIHQKLLIQKIKELGI